MALTPCPECWKPVSDQAETCPHCGFKLPAHYEKERRKEGNRDKLSLNFSSLLIPSILAAILWFFIIVPIVDYLLDR